MENDRAKFRVHYRDEERDVEWYVDGHLREVDGSIICVVDGEVISYKDAAACDLELDNDRASQKQFALYCEWLKRCVPDGQEGDKLYDWHKGQMQKVKDGFAVWVDNSWPTHHVTWGPPSK